MEELSKMMVQTFNDGCEQVIFPRLEIMQEEIEVKIEESERRIKKELREEFRTGQQSLANSLEEVSRKLDYVAKDHGKRLDKVERIIKAN